MSNQTRERLIFFAIAVFFHIGLFLLLKNIVVEETVRSEVAEGTFQQINISKISAPPSALIPVPQYHPTTPPIIIPTGDIPPSGTTSFTSFFKLPSPSIPVHFNALDRSVGPLHAGDSENSTGKNDNEENQVKEVAQDIEIDRNLIVTAVLNSDSKMSVFNKSALAYLKGHFNLAHTSENKYLIWTALDGSGKYSPISHPDISAQLVSDLYGTIDVAIKMSPRSKAILVVSDFDDEYLQDATDDLIKTLRQKHLKLILFTSKMAAYPGLAEYARESRGSYQKLSFKNETDSIGLREDNPVLPLYDSKSHQSETETHGDTSYKMK